VIGAPGGKQSHHPEGREQTTQARDLLAFTGCEIETVEEAVSVDTGAESVNQSGAPLAGYY
jgi:hypothetical protein